MRKVLFIILFITLPFKIIASDLISKDNLIGSADFKYYLWNVYEAKLYSQNEFSFDKPFALSLIYKRKLDGEKIALRSIEEMKKIGLDDESQIAKWQQKMIEIFPDVADGVNLTGVLKPNKSTVFLQDGKQIGVFEDEEFAKWFFGIWLNEKTSEPELRAKLLNLK